MWVFVFLWFQSRFFYLFWVFHTLSRRVHVRSFSCYCWCFSCLMFCELPWAVTWFLTVIWRKFPAVLLWILLLFLSVFICLLECHHVPAIPYVVIASLLYSLFYFPLAFPFFFNFGNLYWAVLKLKFFAQMSNLLVSPNVFVMSVFKKLEHFTFILLEYLCLCLCYPSLFRTISFPFLFFAAFYSAL